MKCKDCEHFKRLYPPMGQYDSGRVMCDKHNLVKDYTSTQSINQLTCIEKEGAENE